MVSRTKDCVCTPIVAETLLAQVEILQWDVDDAPAQRLGKLEQVCSQCGLSLKEAVPLLAGLLSLPLHEDKYAPLDLMPQQQRQKTLETIVAMWLALAERQPVFFVLEDLHWTDPSTLELLELLVEQVPTTSIYVLLTCRPEFQAPWEHRSYVTYMTLNRLSRDDVEQMVEHITGGKALPLDVMQQLVEQSDAVPLYIEECTKAVLESGALKDVGGHYELGEITVSLQIPAMLQDSLMARLDRLMTAKGTAQLGAVIGRQFDYALLHAVAHLDEHTLQHDLSRLVASELVYQRGFAPHATYTFKHALIQDIAYESLLRRTRQGYHLRIAEVLETQFPDTAETQPELLAHHFMTAGLNEQAIGYWQRAGARAVARSANQEAIHHLRQGLTLLDALPASPWRTQHELELLTTLGPALMATKGYADADVEATYARAQELCHQVEQTPQLFPILWGLWLFSTARARHQTARALGEHLLTLAQQNQDMALLLEAHHALWTTLFHLGEVRMVHEHVAQGLALYEATHHYAHTFIYGGHDPGVCGYNFDARALWLLGYPEQALHQSREALALAQQLDHPFSLALAHYVAAMIHQARREAHAVQEQAKAALAIATAHGFPYVVALSTLLRGWALTEQQAFDLGLSQMHQGFTALRATGNETFLPWFLAALAEAYGKASRIEQGLTALDEALRWVAQNEERSIEAELYRLRGELLLQQSDDQAPEAETCFHQAISIAQVQSAKSWELRASTSLARLWQRHDRRQDAYNLLAFVYRGFTEGFDTADAMDAKTLLETCS